MRKAVFYFFCLLPSFVGCESDKRAEEKKSTIVIDFLDRKVDLKDSINRIISLAPSMTELIYMIHADSLLVGRTQNCDYPKGVLNISEVNTYPVLDIERVLELKPDLVFAYEGMTTMADAEKLTQLGIPVYFGAYNSLETWSKGVYELAHIFRRDKPDIETFKSKKRPARSVLVLCSESPLYAFGQNTLVNDMLVSLEAENVINAEIKEAYPLLNLDFILATDADILITTFDNHDTFFHNYPELKRMKAYQNNNYFYIHPDILTRPGSRVGQAYRQIEDCLEK